MIVNTAGLSSLYDMYKQSYVSSYTQEGQPIVTKEMWDKYWTIVKGTTNYLSGEGEPFWKNVTLNCLDLMDHVASYMVGEFDCHNDDDLNEIWAPLIKAWYFSKVWIIKSEKVMALELALGQSDLYRTNVSDEKLLRGNPYRIFELTSVTKRHNPSPEESNYKYTFKSILTGIDGFDLDPKEMIYLSINEGMNWRKWWKINMEYIAGKSRVVDATKALSKTVQVIVRNKDNFKSEQAQIENPSVFYELKRQTGTVGAKEQNIYQEMPIIDSARVKDMLEIVESMYERECELLGFTINSNDKKERLTVAENYKDLRQITNLQDFQLKNLKIFEKRLKDKGWVKENFKIEISGLTYAQGLPDTVQANGTINSQWSQEKPVQE